MFIILQNLLQEPCGVFAVVNRSSDLLKEREREKEREKRIYGAGPVAVVSAP